MPGVTKILTTAAIMVVVLLVLSRTAAGSKLGLSKPV
jgi:hypothetical protein